MSRFVDFLAAFQKFKFVFDSDTRIELLRVVMSDADLLHLPAAGAAVIAALRASGSVSTQKSVVKVAGSGEKSRRLQVDKPTTQSQSQLLLDEPLIVAEPAAELIGARVTARALAAGADLGSERLRRQRVSGAATSERMGGVGTLGYEYVDEEEIDILAAAPPQHLITVAADGGGSGPLFSIAVAAAAAAAAIAATEAQEGWGGVASPITGAVDETALLSKLNPTEKLALLNNILAAERAKGQIPPQTSIQHNVSVSAPAPQVMATTENGTEASDRRHHGSHRHRSRREHRRSRSRDRDRSRDRRRKW